MSWPRSLRILLLLAPLAALARPGSLIEFELEDATNILVFAADGRLAHQAHGREVAPEVLSTIVARLRELSAPAGS